MVPPRQDWRERDAWHLQTAFAGATGEDSAGFKSNPSEYTMSPPKDKYDLAIEYLTEHPGEIDDAWGEPQWHEAGCLFGYCAKTATDEVDGLICGCLTQVKHENMPALTEELTQAIRADTRIPRASDITVSHLPIFAEWQRRIDKELGRV